MSPVAPPSRPFGEDGTSPRTRYGPLDDPSPEEVDVIPQNRTPGEITPEILAFCRQITPTREPLLVPRRPAPGAASGNPFALLKDHASRHGGGVRYGWTITEQPGWYLEAEFHAVRVAPTGELIGITPGQEGVSSLLFLPDSGRTFQGESLPNQFHALSPSPDVQAVSGTPSSTPGSG